MSVPPVKTPAATAAKPAGSSAPAPGAASWAYAEDFVAETDASAQARAESEPLGVTPLTRGAVSTLTFLARVVSARAAVEVGTGAGVSGLALFAGMAPDGILTSVDIEADHQRQARKAFLSVGIPNRRFRLISGNASSVLPKLSDGAYDLVFVDGDKLDYLDYVEQGLRLLRHGGVLVVNDALWGGRDTDTDSEDETEAVRTALALVADNEDLVATLLPVGNGLLAAVKR